MKHINEYFSQSEKVSLISEYLLSKNKTNTTHSLVEDYVICCPTYSTFIKFNDLYSDSVVRDSSGYLLFILKKDIVNTYIKKNTKELTVFEIPEEYTSINDLKFDILDKKIEMSKLNIIYGNQKL